MIQPGKAQLEVFVGGLQELGNHMMHTDRDITQTNDFRFGIAANGFGDNAGWVSEVNDPGIGGQSLNVSSNIKHHRNGTQRFGKATNSGRLLTEQVIF